MTLRAQPSPRDPTEPGRSHRLAWNWEKLPKSVVPALSEVAQPLALGAVLSAKQGDRGGPGTVYGWPVLGDLKAEERG